MNTRTIVLLFIAAHCAAPASAQEIIIANCTAGAGCSFMLPQVSGDVLKSMIESNDVYRTAEDGDIIVFTKDKNGRELHYVEKNKSRSELDRQYGGDGFTMIYPFNPMLQPLDGTWRSTIGTVSGNDCYVDIVSIFKRIEGNTMGGNVTFPKPFRVSYLFQSPDMKWIQISTNKYRGVLDFGQGAKSPMKLTFNVHIISEEKIEGVFDCTIKIPVKGTCHARIPVTYRCIAPGPGQRDRDNEIDPFREPHKPRVLLIEDAPLPDVDRIEDAPKPQVDRIGDKPPPKVDRIEDGPKPQVERLGD